jgi:hypothetical protein
VQGRVSREGRRQRRWKLPSCFHRCCSPATKKAPPGSQTYLSHVCCTSTLPLFHPQSSSWQHLFLLCNLILSSHRPSSQYISPYPTGINSSESSTLGRDRHHVPPFLFVAGPRLASLPPAHKRQRRQPGRCLQEPDKLEHLPLADPGQSSPSSYKLTIQSLICLSLDTSRGFLQLFHGPGEWCDCQSLPSRPRSPTPPR